MSGFSEILAYLGTITKLVRDISTIAEYHNDFL